MATNYPTSLDTLTNPTSSDSTTSPSHASQHSDANDAIEALQAKVGVDSSAVADSLDYKVTNSSSVSPGHKHEISDNTDVDTTGVSDGQTLVYESASGEWKPNTSSTPNASTTVAGKSEKATDAEIEASTATGGSGAPLFVPADSSHLPSDDEMAALAGEGGTPNSSNPFLTVASLTGVVLPFAGATAPTGWLLSYGQEVSRTTYAALFAIVGTTYGVGDGSTTFNLPDLRGNFPLGKDNMGGASRNRVTDTEADTLGDEAGAQTHTLVESEIPAHTHEVTGATGGAGSVLAAENSGSDSNKTTTSTGGGGAHENMPPYMTLNYIIKT